MPFVAQAFDIQLRRKRLAQITARLRDGDGQNLGA